MSAIHQTSRKDRPGLVALNAASTIIDAHEADIMITIQLHPGTRDNWLAMARGFRVACVEDGLMEARYRLGALVSDRLTDHDDFVTVFTPIQFAGNMGADQQINLFDPYKPLS